MSANPTTSKLLTLRRAIETGLKQAGIVREVMPFAQLIEAADLKAISIASPGAFVALTSVPNESPQPPGDTRVTVRAACAIACKPTVTLSDDDHALVVAEAVFVWVGWQRFGIEHCGPALKRRIEILPVPGRQGVALLAVQWEHSLRLGPEYPDPDGVNEALRPSAPLTLILAGDAA